MFRPDDYPDPRFKNYLVEADYSQVEVRVMALASQDESLLDYFRKGLDVHRSIAAKIHGVSPEKVKDEQRTGAKATVFGLCYGQGVLGLSQKLGISMAKADKFFSGFFQEFAAVERWIKETQKCAIKTGQVETLFGRIRRLPNAMLKNEKDPFRGHALRQAINSPIQGTAADILNIKMSELWFYLKENQFISRMVLTVHDSIVSSVPGIELPAFLKASKRIMQDFSSVKWVTIPIVTDFKIGDRWGRLKSISSTQIDQMDSNFDIEEFLRGEVANGKAA
jgi:DNA polymerase-1